LDPVLPLLDDWLLRLVPFALTTVALALAYRVMPARHVPVRHALAGALFAGLLFEIVKHLFVAYVMRVPTYNMVYGTFASVPIFLFWLFCCWVVVLVGAETAATFSYFGHDHALSARRESDAQSLGEAIRLLDALAGSDTGNAQGVMALRFKAPMPIDAA
jgi:membrane protein